MRFIKTKLAGAAIGLTLSLGACDEGLTDLNKNPNAPENVGPEFLFPQGTSLAVETIRGEWFDLHLTSLWPQHYAKIQYVDEDWYEFRPEVNNAFWRDLYSGPLMDFTDAIERATAANRPRQIAPAMIMKAWTFGAMTDLWGDIPFTEANQGLEGVTSPVYDPQSVVYDGILKLLVDAGNLLPGTGDGYGNADLIYAGNAASFAKWEKFANSLRARYGMRLSKRNATKAQAEVTAALAAGVFTSLDDQAMLRWPGDGTNDNPFYNNFVIDERDDHRVSKRMVDTLKALNDPRLPVYANLPEDPTVTDYVGVQNGLSSSVAGGLGLAKTSRIGDFFWQPNTPSILMSYWEVLFIEAEARARTWVAGDPAEKYNAAIRANMEYLGIDDAAIDAYLARPEVVYNPATGLTQIAFQKWISLFNQGSEAYAEWRRSGVPVLTPGPAASLPTVARRLTYPVLEQSLNAAHLDEAEARQGGAELTNRVWWDMP
jgi:Starch-binding associating with outer membrane